MNKKKFQVDWSSTMEKIKKQETSTFKDERLYYPQFSEAGIAQAIIRFLPNPVDGEIPFVSNFSHSIKGMGGWYIENCPTTIKKECPVCKANTAIWDSDPDTVRSRSRKKSYYTNILVVKDPMHPENEGKVWLFKYGKKVHEKIMEKLQPPEGGINEPVMVFDYYKGADFKLIIKKIKVNNVLMPNYDSCTFNEPSPIGTDEAVEKIHNSLYKLDEFIAESNFKPYDELEAKFNRVVGVSKPTSIKVADIVVTGPKTEAIVKAPDNTTETSVFDDKGSEGNVDSFFEDLKKDD